MRKCSGFLAAVGASLLFAPAARSQVEQPVEAQDGAQSAQATTPALPAPSLPGQQPAYPTSPMPAQPGAVADPAMNQPAYSGQPTYRATTDAATTYATPYQTTAPMVYGQPSTGYPAPAPDRPAQAYNQPVQAYDQPVAGYPVAAPVMPTQTYTSTTYTTQPTYATTYYRGYNTAPRMMMRRGPFRMFMRRAY